MRPERQPDLFVITGISASGKSTVARALSDRFERSACVEGDTLRTMVRQGRAEMTPKPSTEALHQLDLRYRHTAQLAHSFLDSGFTTVVEDVVLGENLRPFVAALRPRLVDLVVLAPSAEVVAEREANRGKTAYGARWTLDALDTVLHLSTPQLGLWLDSSRLTVEETVDQILHRRDAARLTPVDLDA